MNPGCFGGGFGVLRGRAQTTTFGGQNPNVLMFEDRTVSGLFVVGAGVLLLGEVHAVGGGSCIAGKFILGMG